MPPPHVGLFMGEPMEGGLWRQSAAFLPLGPGVACAPGIRWAPGRRAPPNTCRAAHLTPWGTRTPVKEEALEQCTFSHAGSPQALPSLRSWSGPFPPTASLGFPISNMGFGTGLGGPQGDWWKGSSLNCGGLAQACVGLLSMPYAL